MQKGRAGMLKCRTNGQKERISMLKGRVGKQNGMAGKETRRRGM